VTSGPDGESLTQRHTAAHCYTGYLCTDQLGLTPWYNTSGYKRPIKSTLNQWSDTSWYDVNVGSSSYTTSLVFDIDHNYPVAMEVHEEADGPHLVGHPSSLTTGHWIAVHGYDAYGSWSYYADSVHGTTFWGWAANVPAHSWILSSSLSTMMNYVPYGYIW
jgi:hypothetical protein